MMDTGQIVLILVLVIFNISTIRLISIALKDIKFDDALKEKGFILKAGGTGTSQFTNDKDMTSYSRVAGVVGAIVLATFLWALGNIVLYFAIEDADKISTILGNVGDFFLAGAALFAPYAFNQLKHVFSVK